MDDYNPERKYWRERGIREKAAEEAWEAAGKVVVVGMSIGFLMVVLKHFGG